MPRSGYHSSDIPTFTVFTEYVSGVPHLVTVRPAAIPESKVTELSTAVEIAGVLKRDRVVKLYKPSWAFTTINARVSVALNATNLTGGGSQSMDRFTSLRDLKPQDILDILEKIAYSGITVFDIEWRLTIVPSSIVSGSGKQQGPPSYCSPKKFKATWFDQTYNDQEIGCAAFSINYRLNYAVHNYSSNPNRALKEALALQQKLGWEKDTTLQDLSQFTEEYPTWRLVVIQAAFPRSSIVHTGKDFVFNQHDKQKNVVYLLYDSLAQHYGLISSPKEIYRKYLHRNDIKFCEVCVEAYTALEDHECDVNPYSKPEKLEPCNTCGRYGKHSCSETTCRNCKAVYGRGKKGSYESHRCIIYKEPSKKEFMTKTDKPDGNKYGQFVYDCESRIETITTTKSYISDFATVDDNFINGEVVADGCHSESPVSTILRHSNSLEKHVVNLICLENCITREKKIFEGADCIKDFLTFLLEYNQGRNIVIAHNGSGYDTRLIFETAVQLGLKNNKFVPLLQGSKFMQLTIGKLTFRDSMLHLKGSLAALAKDFCPESLVKGYFPHLFHTFENWDYEGELPAKAYFDLPFVVKDETELKKFNEWYSEKSEEVKDGTPWNFQREIKKYCRNDVSILASIIRGYSANAETMVGSSPLFNATGPSFVHDTILIDYTKNLELERPDKNEDMGLYNSRVENIARETGWAVLVPNEYHYARLALRGGRTDVRKLYHEVTEEEHNEGRDIVYQDIVSQYPFQQVNHTFPTGLPKIHVWDVKYYPCTKHQNTQGMREKGTCGCSDKFGDKDCDIVDLVETDSLTHQELLGRCWCQEEKNSHTRNCPKFFGIITVTLTAPKDLYHPVIVGFDRARGKSIASLEDSSLKEVTVTIIELLTALENGYTLAKIHRYDQYTQSNSLWADMILKFFVEKLINSQDILSDEEYQKFYHSNDDLTATELEKKKEALTPDQAQELVSKYEQAYEIGDMIQKAIDEGRFAKNPAKKATAKTMLNSAWGKHAQRPIMTECSVLNHTTDRSEVDDLFQNMAGGVYKFQDATILNDAEVMYRYRADNAKVDLHNGYLPAAVFVTAYARLQLWEQLNRLGDRVLMNDTDSIIYIRDPQGYNIPEGSMLGDWEIEKPCKLNDGLKTFVGFGPKTYAYRTWKQEYQDHTVVKAKGLSLKYSHSKLVNFDLMEKMMKEFLLDPEEYDYRIKVPQKGFSFSFAAGEGMRTIKTVKELRINRNAIKGILHGPYLYPFGHQKNRGLELRTPNKKFKRCFFMILN